MTPQRLSATVQQRIDTAEARDTALCDAFTRFYTATAEVEQADGELFARLDSAWVDALDAIRRVAWLDGWQCGRNPDLLVTETGGEGAL